MGFISIEDGSYYEGDLENILDLKVSPQPTPYHTYNKNMKQWVLDHNKVIQLKRNILAQLDEELKAKTILLNLTSEQKEEARKDYDIKVEFLSNNDDPIILLQELVEK